ncbi:bifunctional folylpolyglutamate synthase/dihydrofolate synthase [Neorickettsia findlayensis]|uniref:bifunctional folylpolyglutamate synthase/dihydrofolate synthase n=1 Tax=Neorickettsia findlayensis TaxID=2686014 RepID=UPI001F38C511|nr:folylpolyglutamate synthase/dihydrofolate synthase family protein [Neorickettsia findlayensis]
MPHWPKPLGARPTEIDLGLCRVVSVLKKLGDPHLSMQQVVHVAGTNGKGSTIAFLRAILQASCYSVDVCTSPHLRYFNERIVLRDREISDKVLYNVLEDVRIASEGEKLTFFEGTTLAAILAFSRSNADCCLIETGMGGRLDATNVFPKPLVTIITAIDFDHTHYLGETIAQIAYEKAGIIKEGVPCVIAKQHSEAMEVIQDVAKSKRAPVFRQGHEWEVVSAGKTLQFSVGSHVEEYPLPNLRGLHQIGNAGNAIAAATILSSRYTYDAISVESVSVGIRNANWPARLQLIRGKSNKLVNMLPEGWEFYMDGAHNPSGASTISAWLNKEQVHIILGMTRDKDTKEFVSHLLPNIESISVVCVQGEPRSKTIQEIEQPILELGLECRKSSSLEDAFRHILGRDSASKKILLCGSLFLFRDIASYGEIEVCLS